MNKLYTFMMLVFVWSAAFLGMSPVLWLATKLSGANLSAALIVVGGLVALLNIVVCMAFFCYLFDENSVVDYNLEVTRVDAQNYIIGFRQVGDVQLYSESLCVDT